MKKTNCIILTGAPGSGKSTLINVLRNSNIKCIDEPARQILAEQRRIGSVPEKNPTLFIELMLSRTTFEYQNIKPTEKIVFFDRGIADNIAYAKLFSLPFKHGWHAAKIYEFNPVVFFMPAWPDIYCNDEERKMSFEAAAAMGNELKSIYQALGYELRDMPLDSPTARAKFLLEQTGTE